MEKNYYEILEVSQNASDEIIEKAYKTLAKKYHPDMQNGKIKLEYEEKMKDINEAYSVLSDAYKRDQYNQEIQSKIVPKEEYLKVLKENILLKEEIKKLNFNISKENNIRQQQIETIGQMYKNIYSPNLKNKVYKKKKRTFKYYKKLFIIIITMILIFILLLQLTPIKTFFINIYNKNILIKAIVDTFISTFKEGF